MNDIGSEQLLTFRLVLTTGSFSRAAGYLGISQPAVSQKVRELERRLQLRLIERVGRSIRATAAGEALLRHAQRVALALDDARAEMEQFTEHAGGPVRMGAGATACIHLLPPLLKRLSRANPLLEIRVSTGNTPEIARRVEDNSLDAALVTLPLSSRALDIRPVLDDVFVAIAPAGAAAGHASVSPAGLATRPLVLFETGANTRTLIDAWFRRAGRSPRVLMELGSVEAIKQMVAADLGWSVVPALSVSSPTTARGLRVLRLAPRLSRSLAWIVRRDKPLSRALRQVQEGVLALGDPGGR